MVNIAKGPSSAHREGNHAARSAPMKEVAQYPSLDWADVEDEVEHCADFAAKFMQSQIGHKGILTITMTIPTEYLHAAMDAHENSAAGMVYIRVYHVDEDMFREAKKMRDQEALDALMIDDATNSGGKL